MVDVLENHPRIASSVFEAHEAVVVRVNGSEVKGNLNFLLGGRTEAHHVRLFCYFLLREQAALEHFLVVRELWRECLSVLGELLPWGIVLEGVYHGHAELHLLNWVLLLSYQNIWIFVHVVVLEVERLHLRAHVALLQ